MDTHCQDLDAQQRSMPVSVLNLEHDPWYLLHDATLLVDCCNWAKLLICNGGEHFDSLEGCQ